MSALTADTSHLMPGCEHRLVLDSELTDLWSGSEEREAYHGSSSTVATVVTGVSSYPCQWSLRLLGVGPGEQLLQC